MSSDAQNLINAFELLPQDEQQLVAAEILRRSVSKDELTDENFDSLAAEVFQLYDAEESSGADS
jgi:hypothetical protein